MQWVCGFFIGSLEFSAPAKEGRCSAGISSTSVGLGRECDGHDNRLRSGIASRLHRVLYSGRPLFDGVAGVGLLVPFPKVVSGSSAAPILASG